MAKKKNIVLVKFDKLKTKEDGFVLMGKTIEGQAVFMKPENLSERFADEKLEDRKKSYLLASYLGRKIKVEAIEEKDGLLEVSALEVVKKAAEELAKENEKDKEKKYKAVVQRVTMNGAYLLISDVECFMPNRAFSLQKSVFVKDFLTNGQKIDVKISSIKGTKILVEAFKKFEVAAKEYKAFKEDEIVVGKIMGFHEFGIFVQLDKGIDAICSIPEYEYDKLKVGDTITIRIININEDKKNIRAKYMFKHND